MYSRHIPIYHDDWSHRWSSFNQGPFYSSRLSRFPEIPPAPITTRYDPDPFFERAPMPFPDYERRELVPRSEPAWTYSAPPQSAPSLMENEMRKMTQEMNNMTRNFQRMGPASGLKSVEDMRLTEDFNVNNPVQQDIYGNRRFQLEFDLRQFRPEEIHIKTTGNQLSVHCKHEEKENGKSSFKEYNRQFVLPKEVNPEHLTSKLSADGTLHITAPLPALPSSRDRLIPIDKK
ncbi:heat shock protein 30C-like [Saccostrea echinata]|uniref:heat shock protein 30C-like n=1 Tax=Saccostrea echinata TaxID=191078 RepID=UPI002A82E400|nr:heat shock protein 30C-like [Saccostrea echinata]